MVAPELATKFVNSLLSDYISQDAARRGRQDITFRLLAVSSAGPFEERLRKVTRSLGEQVTFVRSFAEGEELARTSMFEIVLLVNAGAADAERTRGMAEFVRCVKRLNGEAVVVVAAPCAELERLADVMLEGVYDFLPLDCDDFQLRLMMGRLTDHARLRRRSSELERALHVQNSALRERFEELALLNEMSRDMNSVPDLDEMLRRVLPRILEAFGSRCGSLLLIDPEAGDLVVRAAAGPGSNERLGQRRKLGEGIAGKVAQGRNPILVTDIQKDSRFTDIVLNRGDEGGLYRSPSFIAVPLIHHGRLIGEINITEKDTGEAFTADDLRLLSILSGHIASAVRGSLAAEELRTANADLREQMVSAHRRLMDFEGLADGFERMMPAALAAFDRELRVTFANGAARDLLGLEQGLSLPADDSELSVLTRAAVAVIQCGCGRTLVMPGMAASPSGKLNIVLTPLRQDGEVSGGAMVGAAAGCPMLASAGEWQEESSGS